MKYLLGTWEVLLDGMKSLRTRDRYIIYRIITKIICRREFLLEENGYSSLTRTISPSRYSLMKRFSSLLATTCVSCESILHESTSAVPVLFASKVLSIASLLLPSVRRCLFGGMVKLYPSSSIKVPDLTQDIFADFRKPVVTSLGNTESPIHRSHH
ncbi:hypothetical protein WA171_004096 [Blastocystis sp. BT1]